MDADYLVEIEIGSKVGEMDDPSEKTRRLVLILERVGLWVIWAGLLLGCLSFVGVMTIIFNGPSTGPAPNLRDLQMLLGVSVMFGVVVIPLAHLARWLVFRWALRRRSWRAMAIAYPIGKLVTWLACDFVAFFAMVVCIIAHSFVPAWPMALCGWACILADLPLFGPFRRIDAA
jgi:hypothetical protein